MKLYEGYPFRTDPRDKICDIAALEDKEVTIDFIVSHTNSDVTITLTSNLTTQPLNHGEYVNSVSPQSPKIPLTPVHSAAKLYAKNNSNA